MGSRRFLLFTFGKLAVAAALISIATLPVAAQTGTDASSGDGSVVLATLPPSMSTSSSPFPSASPLALAPVMPSRAPGKPKVAQRTVDGKFLILFGMAAALTVTDIELTQHCLQAGTCQEANFLYGSNPTRARMYGFNLPVLGAQTMLSAWLKRRHPEGKQWMAPPIADSVAHGIGSITGAMK